MHQNIKKSILFFFSASLLQSCSGDILFRKASCSDSQVRKGNTCVSANAKENTDCKDPDLNKVHKGETVTLCDGSLVEGKFIESTKVPVCTKDGEQDCVVKSSFKVVDFSTLSSSDIKNGKVIAGVTGSFKYTKPCRNYSSLSTFDSSYPPGNLGWSSITFLPAAVNIASDRLNIGAHGLTTNSPVQFTSTISLPTPLVAGTIYYAIFVSTGLIEVSSVPNGAKIDIIDQGTGTHTAHDVPDSTAQYFDTVDDNNNNQTSSPTNNPWNSSDYLCDASNFVNVTSTSAPFLPSGMTPATGNQAFTQIWQDKLSESYISNILTASAAGRYWSDAIRTCESLNGGTAGDGWRLPTQKELLQLYIHGISKVPLYGGSTNALFWSSTGSSTSTAFALRMNLSIGLLSSINREDTTNSVLCTR